MGRFMAPADDTCHVSAVRPREQRLNYLAQNEARSATSRDPFPYMPTLLRRSSIREEVTLTVFKSTFLARMSLWTIINGSV